MILTAHQPAYLPWLGYFDKMARADIFVYLDRVQYEKNSFINRNRLKSAQGPFWVTVPVLHKGHTSSHIGELRINGSVNWKRKHLNGIRQAYGRAPFFQERDPRLEILYAQDHELLTDLCWRQLDFWRAELGIQTRLVRLSELGIRSRKSQLVLDLCRHFGARRYLSGTLGRDYLSRDDFQSEGIEIVFQDYRHPTYPQLHGDFEPNLGIIDLWMNSDRFDCIWEDGR